MNYQIINGHSAEVLKTFPDNHFDSIVTDPPYLIGFLGKEWDAADNFQLDVYKECLRVLKPGGHILAFSAARTYHHLAVTLEQAGFEIRDQIMWIYSSGFPKSQDVGKSIERTEKKRADNALGIKRSKIESGPKTNCPKCNKTLNGSNQTLCQEEQCDLRDALAPAQNEWAGWGTALKPAHEPIALARKPIKLSIAKNCQTHGVGALNIDATRIPYEGDKPKPATFKNGISYREHTEELYEKPVEHATERVQEYNDGGRFPSNVLGEIPDYQKYFYCPKVSRRERHIGFEDPGPRHPGADGGGYQVHNVNDELITKADKKKKHDPLGHIPTDPSGKYDNGGYSANQEKLKSMGNNHPTVKPIALMKYLIKLITPKGGRVLDPFNGSGSTGCAAVELGHEYVGIELDAKYVEIAKKRIEAWNKEDTAFSELFE